MSVEGVHDALTGEERFAHYVVPEIDVMLRVARSITGSAAEAEDLVQDSLLRAFRSIDAFDGRHPRAWLLTIVRNTHINRNRRQRPVLLDDPDAPETAGRDGEVRSPEDDYLDGTFDAAVERSLRALPEDGRRVIELVDLAGLSYAEAAEVLDVPVGTVMSRLHRARRRVREDLRGSGLAPRRFR
jgi:RNA polymerase sigma-70 factor (ECF subfamily)